MNQNYMPHLFSHTLSARTNLASSHATNRSPFVCIMFGRLWAKIWSTTCMYWQHRARRTAYDDLTNVTTDKRAWQVVNSNSENESGEAYHTQGSKKSNIGCSKISENSQASNYVFIRVELQHTRAAHTLKRTEVSFPGLELLFIVRELDRRCYCLVRPRGL